jgi:hypothetical protein
MIVLLLSGCEAMRAGSSEDHLITMDCKYTHPDGSSMACNHHLTKDLADKEEGASVNMPIKQ